MTDSRKNPQLSPEELQTAYQRQLAYWKPIIQELAKAGIIDLGDAEAGKNRMRGLSKSFLRTVGELHNTLLTDPKSNIRPFRDLMIEAVMAAIGVFYERSLTSKELQERLFVIYPLIVKGLTRGLNRVKPPGWKELLKELPIASFSKLARVRVHFTGTTETKKATETISRLYS